MVLAEVACFNQDDYMKRIPGERMPQVITIRNDLNQN